MKSHVLWESLVASWSPPADDPNIYAHWAAKSDHEWMTLNNTNSSLPVGMSISISTCFGEFSAVDLSIVVTSKSDQIEPSITSNTTESSSHTSTICNQLGVTGLNITDRAIMKMDPPNFLNRVIRTKRNETIRLRTDPAKSSQILWSFCRFSDSCGSWSLCNSCIADEVKAVHPSQSIVFEDSIRTTWHPALAIQAFVTTSFGMLYHESLLSRDETGDVEVVFSVPSQIPQKHTALVFVLVGLFIHLTLVALTTTAFLSLTRYSMLGNAWYAIAQMSTPEVLNILDFPGATGATDMEVKGRLKEDGRASLPVQLKPASCCPDSDEKHDTAVTIAFADT
ncbi:hypothetical protein MMC16_007935 [Acarospora aff. strigata]|nr:hypothetical protein [Acarospora aff. strigata]